MHCPGVSDYGRSVVAELGPLEELGVEGASHPGVCLAGGQEQLLVHPGACDGECVLSDEREDGVEAYAVLHGLPEELHRAC